MTQIPKTLVTGMGRQAGTQDAHITAVKGDVRITRSRVIVNENGIYTIFDKDAAQILEEKHS